MKHIVIQLFQYSNLVKPVKHNCLNNEFITYFIQECIRWSQNPKITDFLTHFWSLLRKRKREYIVTKPCILNIFGSPLSIYEVKITLPCTGKPMRWILLKKSTENLKFFFLFTFFEWIKHIYLFKTMDKGEENSCSL